MCYRDSRGVSTQNVRHPEFGVLQDQSGVPRPEEEEGLHPPDLGVLDLQRRVLLQEDSVFEAARMSEHDVGIPNRQLSPLFDNYVARGCENLILNCGLFAFPNNEVGGILILYAWNRVEF